MRNDVLQRFLCKTEVTRRSIVQSKIMDITSLIKPFNIDRSNNFWGDIDPTTKMQIKNYKYPRRGAIKKGKTLIPSEKELRNISILKGSSLLKIDLRDYEYELQGET